MNHFMNVLRDKFKPAADKAQHICRSTPADMPAKTFLPAKTLVISKSYFYAMICFGPLFGVTGIGWGMLQQMNSPSVVTLRATESDEGLAYDNKISDLKDALNEAQSRLLVAKATTEQKIKDLISRQKRIEANQAIVTSLAETALPIRMSSAKATNVSPLLGDTFGSPKAMELCPKV